MAKYEEKALKVVDESQYDLKEGQKPRKLSDKKHFGSKYSIYLAPGQDF